MKEQYEVTEIQNKTRSPFVFDVEDYLENRTPEAAVIACEEAAMAKYHDIMVAAYSSNVAYCGAQVLHFIGRQVIQGPYEIIERQASN